MELVIRNLDIAIKHFRQMPDKVKTAMQIAAAMSLRDIQRTAQHNHRFISRTGNLERSVATEVYNDTISGRVYLDDTKVAYGPFVHTGTRAHDITPQNKRALRWPISGGFAFAMHVHHPGTKPDEFLYSALRSNEPQIRKRYYEAMAKAVTV